MIDKLVLLFLLICSCCDANLSRTSNKSITKTPTHTQLQPTNELHSTFRTGSLRSNIANVFYGQEAEQGRHLYIVSLQNAKGLHSCAGSLIAPNVVLSAAHCANVLEGGTAVIGQHNLAVDYYYSETFKIEQIIVHPNYEKSRLKSDIMLVKLNGQSSYPIVTLNRDKHVPFDKNDNLTAMGWGQTENGFPDLLMDVDFKYVPNSICKEAKGEYCNNIGGQSVCKHGSYSGIINEYNMCATGRNEHGNVEDVCQGDSGGPLIIKGLDDERDLQVGIVSGGVECSNANFPGIYSRISYHIDWIEENTCDLSLNAHNFSCDQTSKPSMFLTYVVRLDDYPEEHSWKLYELIGNVEQLVSASDTYAGKQHEIVTETIPVNLGKQYKFVIRDAYGDGLLTKGANTQLYQGIVEDGMIITEWFNDWGKGQEATFSVSSSTGLSRPPPTNAPTLAPTEAPTNAPTKVPVNEEHHVTLRLWLDNHPENIHWHLRSNDGDIYVYSSPQKYTVPNKVVTERIPIVLGKKYTLVIKGGKKGQSKLKYIARIFNGNIGEGRLLKTFRTNKAKLRAQFWIPKFRRNIKTNGICNNHESCSSGQCSWGKCL